MQKHWVFLYSLCPSFWCCMICPPPPGPPGSAWPAPSSGQRSASAVPSPSLQSNINRNIKQDAQNLKENFNCSADDSFFIIEYRSKSRPTFQFQSLKNINIIHYRWNLDWWGRPEYYMKSFYIRQSRPPPFMYIQKHTIGHCVPVLCILNSLGLPQLY